VTKTEGMERTTELYIKHIYTSMERTAARQIFSYLDLCTTEVKRKWRRSDTTWSVDVMILSFRIVVSPLPLMLGLA